MNVGNVSESRISAGNEFHNLAPDEIRELLEIMTLNPLAGLVT